MDAKQIDDNELFAEVKFADNHTVLQVYGFMPAEKLKAVGKAVE